MRRYAMQKASVAQISARASLGGLRSPFRAAFSIWWYDDDAHDGGSLCTCVLIRRYFTLIANVRRRIHYHHQNTSQPASHQTQKTHTTTIQRKVKIAFIHTHVGVVWRPREHRESPPHGCVCLDYKNNNNSIGRSSVMMMMGGLGKSPIRAETRRWG